MLVLARRPEEIIFVDFSTMTDSELLALRSFGPIQIKIVNVRGDKVRLGFEAPGCVKIDRKELVQKREEQAARSIDSLTVARL